MVHPDPPLVTVTKYSCTSMNEDENVTQLQYITVKPAIFMCPLFHEFHNLGDFAKTTDREYSKSCTVFSQSLSSASKNTKITGAKII